MMKGHSLVVYSRIMDGSAGWKNFHRIQMATLIAPSKCLPSRKKYWKKSFKVIKKFSKCFIQSRFLQFFFALSYFFQFKTKRIKIKAVCQRWYFYPVMLKIKWLLGLKMGYDGSPGCLTTESGWVRFQAKKLLADSNSLPPEAKI